MTAEECVGAIESQTVELARLRAELDAARALLRAVYDGVKGQWSDEEGCWIAVDVDAILRVRAALAGEGKPTKGAGLASGLTPESIRVFELAKEQHREQRKAD